MTKHQHLEQDGWVTSDTPHYQAPWVISAVLPHETEQMAAETVSCLS